jgi:hypothetical protein
MILRIKFNPIGGKIVIAILVATGGLFPAIPGAGSCCLRHY